MFAFKSQMQYNSSYSRAQFKETVDCPNRLFIAVTFTKSTDFNLKSVGELKEDVLSKTNLTDNSLLRYKWTHE